MVSDGEERDGARDEGLENTRYNAGTDTLHQHHCPQGRLSAGVTLAELEVVTWSDVGGAVSQRGFHSGESTKDQAVKKIGRKQAARSSSILPN